MRTVELFGDFYPLEFNMEAVFRYEEMTGRQFHDYDQTMLSSAFALLWSMMVAANPQIESLTSKITYKTLMQKYPMNDTTRIVRIVNDAIGDKMAPADPDPEDVEEAEAAGDEPAENPT